MYIWTFSTIHLYIYPKKHIPMCSKCPAIVHVDVWKVFRILGKRVWWSTISLLNEIINRESLLSPCSTYWWHANGTAGPHGISQLLSLMGCRDFDSLYVWWCEWSAKICLFHISHKWNWKFICKYFEGYYSRL